MQGGATRRRVVSHFSTKIPLRRYFSGPAAVGYSLLFVSLLLTPYFGRRLHGQCCIRCMARPSHGAHIAHVGRAGCPVIDINCRRLHDTYSYTLVLRTFDLFL